MGPKTFEHNEARAVRLAQFRFFAARAHLPSCVQELPATWSGWIALIYLCVHRGGEPRPCDAEADAARYFSQRAWEALPEPREPLSDWLVRRVFAGTCTMIPMDPSNPLPHAGAFL